MRFHSVFLYLYGLIGFFRHLRYNLAHELVVGFAVAVLLSLFVYIFNDFLNVQVQELSPAMRRAFATVCGWLLYATAAFALALSLRRLTRAQAGLLRFAHWMGEGLPTIRRAQLLSGGTLVVLFGSTWIGSVRFFDLLALPIGALAGLWCGAATISGLWVYLRRQSRPREVRALAESQNASSRWYSAKRIDAMIHWRFTLFSKRIFSVRIIMGSAAVLGVILAFLSFRHAPPVLTAAVVLTVGLLIFCALSLTLARDLPSSWIDRMGGASHEEFVKSYSQLSWGIGVGASLVTTAIMLAPHLLSAVATWHDVEMAIQHGLLAATPVALFPSLMFQMDGRRPIAQTMVGCLIGLFVGTAVFAHWASSVLIVLIHSWASGLQSGRFYRA